MRCKFCGSKAIYPYTQHEQGSAGRVVAGAIIAGPVGAMVGLAGKNVKGYRCSACGMFSEKTMEFPEELSINSAVRQAQNGDTLSYERYRNKYANLEFVPIQPKVQQSPSLTDEKYDDESEIVGALPETEPEDTSIKHSYSPNQFVVGSPVFISKVTIKDNDGTDVLLLDINNISGKTLRSVYLNITVYDDVGDQIRTSTFAYQGLSAATGETLPQTKPFNLNTNVAYKVDVTCEKAAFTDDTVWRKEEKLTVYTVPERTELVPEGFAQHKYLRVLLAKKGALRVGQKLYYPVVEETHRLCVCGNPAVSGNKCLACGLSETDLQEVMDYDVLVQCRKDVIVKTAKERTEALHSLLQQVQEDKYKEAIRLKAEDTQASCAAAIEIFTSMSGYKDADSLCVICKERLEEINAKAEVARKDGIYAAGRAKMSNRSARIEHFESAIAEFKKIPGWKDADEQIVICQKKIEELKIQEEEELKERERKAEIARAEAAVAAKRKKMTIAIVAVAVCVAIAFLVVFNTIIIPDGKYNDAIALMESGKYSDAISAFEALDGYKDSADKIADCNTAIIDSKYNDAIALMEAGKYSDAVSAFKSLNGYKDSKDKIIACTEAILSPQYDNALALMNVGKYTEALAAFKTLDGYKDSAQKINECTNLILDDKYNNAIALMNSGKYVEAYELLIALGGYKDSAEKASSIYEKYKQACIKQAQVGDYVLLGTYEQDNNTSNGKEQIEWLVLHMEGNKVLLISKYALDDMPYNTEKKHITWENCTLRTWLNNDFLNSAFSASEMALLQRVNVSADENPEHGKKDDITPGNATYDKLFVLSIIEVEKYFDTDNTRQCLATKYVAAKDNMIKHYHGYCSWWLRTPGMFQSYAATITVDGQIKEDGVSVNKEMGVRPAMWIDLSKIS